jgi:putative transposase
MTKGALTQYSSLTPYSSIFFSEVTDDAPTLTRWPVARPRQWLSQTNRPQPKAELEAVQTSVVRGRPFGNAAWQAKTAETLGLESTFQPRGRPRKHK